MIMINNQWYHVDSMRDVQQIIEDEFSYELAREMENYITKHSDYEYECLEIDCSDFEDQISYLEDEINYLHGKLEETESMLEMAEDDVEYYKSRLEEAGLL